ncbi:hypothetical protein HIM_05533 [Hirsutella minnesotensis 3608]|uniref:Uncharacterized protein n=1 Tax=Hirsutella minnesotensis 3608 TaxID=1043627 RepID=A0A0F8A040_9HYPO|nr:hypothetical protein HIM_05533 [Hirsutella minnesotensis 3608]
MAPRQGHAAVNPGLQTELEEAQMTKKRERRLFGVRLVNEAEERGEATQDGPESQPRRAQTHVDNKERKLHEPDYRKGREANEESPRVPERHLFAAQLLQVVTPSPPSGRDQNKPVDSRTRLIQGFKKALARVLQQPLSPDNKFKEQTQIRHNANPFLDGGHISGCSGGDASGPWRMGRSMIAAFNALRGHETIETSILVQWAEQNRGHKKKSRSRRDNVLVRTHEQQVMPPTFTISRPPYEHILPPAFDDDAGDNKPQPTGAAEPGAIPAVGNLAPACKSSESGALESAPGLEP